MKAPYKLVYRTTNGKQITLGGWKCHATKSTAGRLFQLHSVKNVRVYDKRKNLYLRLSKNKNGKALERFTVSVPSSLALFG